MSDPTTSGPLEPPGGQDDPPNVGLLIGALLVFLIDLRNRVGDDLPHDLRLRRKALEAVLRRARHHGVGESL